MGIRRYGRYIKRKIKTNIRLLHPGAVILMYHRISNVAYEPNWLAVSPENFSDHLNHINKHYNPLRLLELIQAIESGTIPRRSVVITFDDGYLNNLTQALPLLEAAHIPATVFATAGFIGCDREFWWDQLSHILLASPSIPPDLSLNIGGTVYKWHTVTIIDRQNTFSELKEVIKPLRASIKGKVLDYIVNWAGVKSELRQDFRAMTVDELKMLARSEYIELGAHTVNHPILPTLPYNEQVDEIVKGRNLLSEMVDLPIETFAYPNGDCDDHTARIVETAGYRGACTTTLGRVEAEDNLFRLKRCIVNDWDLDTFKRKMERYFHI